MKHIKALLFLLIALGLTSCSSEQKKPLTIALNPWVGYTPFYYMKESGILKKNGIKLLSVTSLSESVKLMESGVVNVIGGTQHEYHHLQKTTAVTPFLLLDRSNGADALFSNLTTAKMKESNDKIDVFLELGGVNELLFELFLKQNSLDSSKFVLINADQYTISRQALKQTPTMLITYEPYLATIKRNGYIKVADSNDEGLFIVDILIVNSDTKNLYEHELAILRKHFNNVLYILKKDPKRYYEKVKPHLDGQSYEEFIQSLDGIKWMTKTDQKLLNTL